MRKPVRSFHPIGTTMFLVVALHLDATVVLAAGPTKVHNQSNYDLWVCVGRTIDRSLEGVNDPNPRLVSEGWFKLPRGGTLGTPPRIRQRLRGGYPRWEDDGRAH